MTWLRRTFCLLASVGCVVLPRTAASVESLKAYRFSELGIPMPMAINNAGNAVGFEGGPLFSHKGAVFPIPSDGAAVAINASGDVLVNMATDIDWQLRAFLWRDATGHPLSVEKLMTRGWGINNAGCVVGAAALEIEWPEPWDEPPPQPWVAVQWSNEFCYRILGTLGAGYSSYAFAINNRGQAVGSSWPTVDTPGLPRMNRAVMFHEGRVEDLGLPEGALTGMAVAINDRGEVAVNCVMTGYGARAYVYSAGKFADLGMLPDQLNVTATAINNAGQVVGIAQVGLGESAFLYSNGRMHHLNELVDLPPGCALQAAMGINDRGQIVGMTAGTLPFRGFLLTPRGDLKRY